MEFKSDLINLTKAHVHFVHSVDFDTKAIDIKIMKASIGHIECDRDIFSVIANAMNFPSYFGKNWDAFDECIEDMDWLPAKGYILILNEASKAFEAAPETIRKLIVSWSDAGEYWTENNKPFHLIFSL